MKDPFFTSPAFQNPQSNKRLGLISYPFLQKNLTKFNSDNEPKSLSFWKGQIVANSFKSPTSTNSNQDAYGLIPLGEDHCLLAVADGMGGHASGEVAAKISIQCLEKNFEFYKRNSSVGSKIIQATDRANKKIRKLGVGAGTTLCIAEFKRHKVRFFSIGDSIGSLVSGKGRVKFRTIEFTPPGLLKEADAMSDKEAMEHEESHLILNFLGDHQFRIEVSSQLKINPRDTILLASDGLTSNLSLEEIGKILSKGSLEEKLTTLNAETGKTMNSKKGHPDDSTIILFSPFNQS